MADTLVLNRSFHAVHIADWRKALTMVYQGHAEVLDDDLMAHDFDSWATVSSLMDESPAGFVHSARLKIAIPEIIRLTQYDRLPKREVAFTRHNIYEHYKYRCCYCGHRFPTAELNLDHVVPRSRGGTATWENIVTACLPCNTRKANRLPNEAGMRLLVQPGRPKWSVARCLMSKGTIRVRESWQKVIDRVYWEGELDQER